MLNQLENKTPDVGTYKTKRNLEWTMVIFLDKMMVKLVERWSKWRLLWTDSVGVGGRKNLHTRDDNEMQLHSEQKKRGCDIRVTDRKWAHLNSFLLQVFFYSVSEKRRVTVVRDDERIHIFKIKNKLYINLNI